MSSGKAYGIAFKDELQIKKQEMEQL